MFLTKRMLLAIILYSPVPNWYHPDDVQLGTAGQYVLKYTTSRLFGGVDPVFRRSFACVLPAFR